MESPTARWSIAIITRPPSGTTGPWTMDHGHGHQFNPLAQFQRAMASLASGCPGSDYPSQRLGTV